MIFVILLHVEFYTQYIDIQRNFLSQTFRLKFPWTIRLVHVSFTKGIVVLCPLSRVITRKVGTRKTQTITKVRVLLSISLK